MVGSTKTQRHRGRSENRAFEELQRLKGIGRGLER